MDDSNLIKNLNIIYENVRVTDQINKRLTIIAVTTIICFAITIISMCAIYFLSDYQYPTITQDVQQDTENCNQKVKQKVEKGGIE